MKQLLKCPECNGDGLYIDSSNNTYYYADGEPVYEQVPVHVQCEACCGYGEVEVDIP